MFKIKETLAHHDGLPLLVTATSEDGRLWGGMTLADGDVPDFGMYAMAMFLLTPEEMAQLEDPDFNALSGNWLRELMAASTTVYIWNMVDSYRPGVMEEDWLPIAEKESEH